MNKRNVFRSMSVYLLALANLAYALRYGFNWLHWVTFGITAIMLALDLYVVLRRGK